MKKEAKKKATLSNNVLLGVLGLLLVVIVGLVVGVAIPKQKNEEVVVGENPSGATDYEPGTIDDPVVQERQNDFVLMSEINDVIKPLSTEDSIKYLDQQMNEYEDDSSMQYRISIMKVNVYLNDNMPEEAMALLNAIDVEALDNNQSMDYYKALTKANEELGNEEERQADEDQYFALYYQVFSKGEDLK